MLKESLRAKRSNPQMDRHAATRLAMTKSRHPERSEGPPRCKWVTKDQIYIDYHDNEWGRRVSEDNILFEFIILESFQAGLSWLTILKRRKGFARAFAKFNPRKVAKFTEKDIKRLLEDEGIIRHRGKIEAAINNAARFLEVQKEYKTFAQYLEQYHPKRLRDGAARSIAFAKDLKKRGFKFIGATTCYAFMQAVGLITEHDTPCKLAKKNTAS